uniref:Cytochrome P450 n=1 Tax=Timema genevievae TaxID=629358 RepID=A0A7R9K8E8_TIMGE|nr:unnamed protein product [Timema genevievae]
MEDLQLNVGSEPQWRPGTVLSEVKEGFGNQDQGLNPGPQQITEGLIVTCMDLFGAGAESVSNTLGFCLLYMVLHPQIQKKVQEELDRVVGRSRKVSLEDRASLPFTEAVLSEVSRINTIAPVCPPHRATKDAYFDGQFIPKDTILIVSLWSLLHDKDHWGDPEVFRPQRFIDSDGKFVKNEWLTPFGIGKRFCMGEPLARNSLFIFFSCVLKEFSFSLPEGEPLPSTQALTGFTAAPQPFMVKITHRL